MPDTYNNSLRLQLFQNGYVPLPCRGKVPMLKGWNAIDYRTRELEVRGGPEKRITSWARRFPDAFSTGVRIENGLGALDADIDDAEAITALLESLSRIAPEVFERAPTRYGGFESQKLALFFRVEGEAFVRLGSRKYGRPGDAADKYHAVEIFGGAPFRSGVCSRQFAILGPRSYTAEGLVESEYVWAEGVPRLDQVRREALPTLTRAQALEVCGAFEAWAEAAGWLRRGDAGEGDGEGSDVYDIDRAATRFAVRGGGAVDYETLEGLLSEREDLRCSASFIAGEVTTTPDRCSVFWSPRYACAVVKDWKTGARHYPKELAPTDTGQFAEQLKETAAELGIELPAAEPNWRERYRGGTPKPSMHNAMLAIEAAGIRCSEDVFHNKMWLGSERAVPFKGEVTDGSLRVLRKWLSDRHGFDLTEACVRDAVLALAHVNQFNPVADMLAEAEANWDGVARLDRVAAEYFNCEDTELNAACVRKTLIGAVARVRQPGCKFDTILVMESPEGWNKSTVWSVLAGEGNFSDERIIGHAAKEVQEQLAGVWIHENADLAGMAKREVETVKAFASRQVDRARPAYGRFLKEQPRHSIEVGTTNARTYLQSQTGNRRFWPVRVVRPIDIAKLRSARLQIWGEAAHCQSAGESLVLEPRLWPAAGVEQEGRRMSHPWEALLNDMVEIPSEGTLSNYGVHGRMVLTRVNNEHRVATRDIFEHVLSVTAGQMHMGHSKTLAEVMQYLGWTHKRFKLEGRPVAGYVRPAPAKAKKGGSSNQR